MAHHARPTPYLIIALHDAGCVRGQIGAITGHTISSIKEILDRYTKLTADQAGAALAKRWHTRVARRKRK